MYRKALLILVIAILLPGRAGTSQPATEITLQATDFTYSPSSITVPFVKSITATIKNDGKVEHDFVIEKINVLYVVKQHSGMNMDHNMSAPEYDPHISTESGESSVITFTPTEAGRYEFFCTIQGHKEAGMIGELIVTTQ